MFFEHFCVFLNVYDAGSLPVRSLWIEIFVWQQLGLLKTPNFVDRNIYLEIAWIKSKQVFPYFRRWGHWFNCSICSPLHRTSRLSIRQATAQFQVIMRLLICISKSFWNLKKKINHPDSKYFATIKAWLEKCSLSMIAIPQNIRHFKKEKKK